MVRNNVGERVLMRHIPHSEIENMNDDEIVVVSRICVNKRLMKVKLSSNPCDQQAAKILFKTLSEVRNHERNRSGSVANVKMTVGDLKKAFTSHGKLSVNYSKTVSNKI